MRKTLILLAFLLCGNLPAQAQVGLFIRPDSSSLSSPVQGQTWLFDSTNNTMQVWNGSSFLVASAPQNNFAAILAPTTSNDNTEGYSPASLWYNTTNGFTYECVDATTSAAIWVQTNNLGALTIPLTQLAQGGAAGGQSLIYNSGSGHWAPGAPAINLSQILQSGSMIGQVPVWNGTNWVPQNISGGGGGGGLPAGGSDNKIISYASSTAGWYNGLSTVSSVTVTTDTTLTVNSPSLILVSPASTDHILTLPVASTCLGKMFTIGQSAIVTGYTTSIETQGPDQIELFNGAAATPFGSSVTIGGAGHGTPFSAPVTLISDGISIWHQLAPAPQIVSDGQLSMPVNSKSTDFDANYGEVDLVTLSGNDVACTLPDATLNPGQQIIVILNQGSSSSYVLTFATTDTQLINSSNFWYSQGFNGGTQATVFTFISNGTNWNVSLSGDMVAGLFNGPNNGHYTGEVATCLDGHTVSLAPILSPNSINSNSTAYGQNSYFVDTSGGNVTITLADATVEPGQMISVTCTVGGNNVNFDSTSSQTINGAAATSFTNLMTVGASVQFVSDGSNWWCMANTFGGVGP